VNKGVVSADEDDAVSSYCDNDTTAELEL